MSCRNFRCAPGRDENMCGALSHGRRECEKCAQYLCMNCIDFASCKLIDGTDRYATTNREELGEQKTAAQHHAEICDDLKELYKRKNADYGDSFAKARKAVPYYTLGKLFDKFSRIQKLMLNEEQHEVADETIEDTLLDLANYSIMEVAERRAEGKGGQE